MLRVKYLMRYFNHSFRMSHRLSSFPKHYLLLFPQFSCSSSVCLLFFEKRKPTNSSTIELRKRRIFCRSLLYFQSFSRKHCEKSETATTIRSFFLRFFLIKNYFVLRRKMSFFFERIHYRGEKKLLSMKEGSNFYPPQLPPSLRKKTH